MGPPLENILMRRYNINYASARNLVADGRVILKMKNTDPWTEELRLECQRLFEAKYGPPLAERLRQEAAALETPKKQPHSEAEKMDIGTPATAPLTPNAENEITESVRGSFADVTEEDTVKAEVKEQPIIKGKLANIFKTEQKPASDADHQRSFLPKKDSAVCVIPHKESVPAVVEMPQKESDATVDASETVASNSVGVPHEMEMALDRESEKEKKKKGLFGWIRKSKKGVKNQ